ncbi:hypothetical protein [Kribbella catacumbae]|uniref:hypothetical protein n=1 Tax=Kribbella catacumbae TaxID=460086 RepID=UPI00039D9DD0|nr:hypothetical protein [Kribbella catacumbae]
MRAETSTTSAVATLSVAVAVAGHVLVGGSASLAVVPQLLAIAAVCWLVGEFVAGHRLLSVVLFAGVQLVVHLTLDSSHPTPAAPMPAGHSSMHDMAGHHHTSGMTMPQATDTATAPIHTGLTDALAMTAAHLLVLLASVALIGGTHRWVQRVLRILARLVPQLPAPAVAIPTMGAAPAAVPGRPHPTEVWLTSNVSRRGPPQYRALLALS